MDYLAPSMFDVSNIDLWKFKMNSYLKALGLYVYLVTTKKSYIENGKYLETNAQAMIALKQTLNNDYLSKVANCDFRFCNVEHDLLKTSFK